MSTSTQPGEKWSPQTSGDRVAILRELDQVLASPHFCKSKRYSALLQFIIEKALAGKTDELKERSLGIAVFGRSLDYDTNNDTVVRYTAGEVRKRLSVYYYERGHESSIRISLPAGSYMPEFILGHDAVEDIGRHADRQTANRGKMGLVADSAVEAPNGERTVVPSMASSDEGTAVHATKTSWAVWIRQKRILLVALAVVASFVVVAAVLLRRNHSTYQQDAVADFWRPVLRGQRPVLICAGSVVFAHDNYSGVSTAGKDSDYSFVSTQSASAIAQITDTLDDWGTPTQLAFSSFTPLTGLREHSVILLDSYSNIWTHRLLNSLRFHLLEGSTEIIVDQMHPQVQWSRDHSVPYSNADDYAIVARFWDLTTDGWVVVIAGLGRNGTEAATQFVFSPHYMQLLRDQVGHEFSNRNIEAILSVKVIDGKAGAPSIVSAYTW
jgi:hypothetical protein